MKTPLFFTKAAEWLARTNEDRQLHGDLASVRAKYVMFVGIGIVLTAIFIPIVIGEMTPWVGFKPKVAINRGDWKFAVETKPALCAEAAGASCPANPSNTTLFEAKRTRADADHSEQLNKLRGHEFWIGTTLGADVLARARSARANYFIVGWINGTYRLWVDGQYYAGGAGRTEYEPILVNLPMDRLSSTQPIRLALKVYHDVEHKTPDPLNGGSGGEGFVTHRAANTYRAFQAFWATTRPFSFALAYGILGMLFFYLWFASQKEPEYFYLALHLIVCSFSQLRAIYSLDLVKNSEMHYSLGLMLESYKALTALLLGMSFARFRSSIFKWGLLVGISLPLAIVAAAPGAASLTTLFYFVQSWLSPAFYLLGGLACFLQAYHLQTSRKEGSYHPVRIRRLLLFGSGLAASAFFYIAYSLSFRASSTVSLFALWYGVEQILLVVFLGFIAVREYRHNMLLADRTPLSEYHQHAKLPERVHGLLLVVDLKCSEPFYRHRAEHGESANLVGVWRSHIYTSASKFGGIVIHKKGDEVAVLFDAEKRTHPASDALQAAIEMARASNLLAAGYVGQNILPADAEGFHFRAAITTADLKPVWEDLGASLEPAWEEASHAPAPFSVIAQLFKFERKITGNRATTLIIIPDELAKLAVSRQASLTTGFISRSTPVQDSGIDGLHVSVYRPEAA